MENDDLDSLHEDWNWDLNLNFNKYLNKSEKAKAICLKSYGELIDRSQKTQSNKESGTLFLIDLSARNDEKGITPSFNPDLGSFGEQALMNDILSNHGQGKLRSLHKEIMFKQKFLGIDLSNNALKELPDWLKADYIFASDNKIEKFPDHIKRIHSLKVLDLSYNQIEQIDQLTFFRKNGHLRVLNLSHNKLKELEFELFNLRNLKVIDLSFNLLDELPSSDYFRGNPKLEFVNLSFLIDTKGWAYFDFNFSKNQEIRNLLLSGNRIQDAANLYELGIHTLSKIQTLDLCGNDLDELIPEIGKCHSLRHLLLEDNKLTELPESIFSLPNLESIYLRENNFTEEYKAFIRIKFSEKGDARVIFD